MKNLILSLLSFTVICFFIPSASAQESAYLSPDTIKLLSLRKFSIHGKTYKVNRDLIKFMNSNPVAKKEYQTYSNLNAFNGIVGATGGVLIIAGLVTKTKAGFVDATEDIGYGFGVALAGLFGDGEEQNFLTEKTNNRTPSKEYEKLIKRGKMQSRLGWGMIAGSMILKVLAINKLNKAVTVFNQKQQNSLGFQFQKIKPDYINFSANPSNESLQLHLSWTLGK